MNRHTVVAEAWMSRKTELLIGSGDVVIDEQYSELARSSRLRSKSVLSHL